jgi:hypothetical protein
VDFFDARCQTGPHQDVQFGLVDDQAGGVAYVDTINPASWIATVSNQRQLPVMFTAIDKCVIQDNQEPGRGRCDCMLTTGDLLYLVELKDQVPPWRDHAIDQLISTIKFLQQYHDISSFRKRKAFAANRKRPFFVELDNELNLRLFRETGFRIDVQATVLIV